MSFENWSIISTYLFLLITMTSLPNESVIQARLKQLSNQEFEIVSTLKQHNYSLDPRLETEMTKKYGAIHEDYTNINNTEALKRAIFI